MVLVDHDIMQFVLNGDLADPQQTSIRFADRACVTNIGYDLRAQSFILSGRSLPSCQLNPGESVFVQSVERVHFDPHTLGRVSLKNSRIRQGFTMDSPVYQPGHDTFIYFRLTNLSDAVLSLYQGESYAMLMFEQLSAAPDHPYSGAFQGEMSFSGLATYESSYRDQIASIDQKISTVKDLEKNVYSNVITLLSIFIAIFTILNVNIDLAASQAGARQFLAFNLMTVGAVAFLIALIQEILHRKQPSRFIWLLVLFCFLALLALLFFI